MSRTYDILGVGDADIDIMVSVKNFPQTGQKSSGKILGQFPGGMVANFLASAATFGAKCCGVLCVGDDSFGKKSLSDLSSRGVQIKDSVVREGESTYFTTTCIAPDGEKRMILCFGGAVYPTEQEIKDESLASANYVHMTGGNTNLTIPVATRAKKLGTKVSFDLERLQTPMADETKDALLSLADIVSQMKRGCIVTAVVLLLKQGLEAYLRRAQRLLW
ncbi:carbohydrate kinase family protein, partial [Ruthenibacterium lactatiformans]|uniref:carbohydrate kinase family protein n=1 Tax=Ruthenibacterium lactatiformans TaxID=1550024 RepID=UPI001966D5CE